MIKINLKLAKDIQFSYLCTNKRINNFDLFWKMKQQYEFLQRKKKVRKGLKQILHSVLLFCCIIDGEKYSKWFCIFSNYLNVDTFQ